MTRPAKWRVSRELVNEMWGRGIPVSEISRELGVPYNAVWYALRATPQYGPKCPRRIRNSNGQRRRRTTARILTTEQRQRKSARGKAWREANREYVSARAAAAYWADVELSRAKAREAARRARARDPEAFREKEREYRRNNKLTRREQRRRYQLNAHFLHNDDREFVFHLWGECCAYCGMRFLRNRDRTLDHIDPLSRGGSHTLGNLAAACNTCNAGKGDQTPEEWRPAIARSVRARAAILGASYLLRK